MDINMVLICIFNMVRHCEHFFMCFLVIWTSSFEKALVSSFAHFFIWPSIFFLSLVFWALCIFWLSIPCQIYCWQNFFPILWGASSI
jgi:hypothetical protein